MLKKSNSIGCYGIFAWFYAEWNAMRLVWEKLSRFGCYFIW